MSNFVIDASVIKRLSTVAKNYHPNVKEDVIKLIKNIRLEHLSGKTYAVVSNGYVGVIEYLGKTSEPDAVAYLKIDERISSLTGWVNVNTIPALKMSVASTLFGESISDVCEWLISTPLDKWQNWITKLNLKNSSGVMQWNVSNIKILLETSSSGELIFPEFIDASRAITVRDRDNPNWVGVLMSAAVKNTTPATVPDWFPA